MTRQEWLEMCSKVYPEWQEKKVKEAKYDSKVKLLIESKNREKRDYWANTGHVYVTDLTEY